MPAQVPFYQQDSTFIPNKPNQNQWRAQAISYPIPGFIQKTQVPIHGQVDMKRNSPRKQESDWLDGYDGPPHNACVTNIWNSSQNVGVTMNEISPRNERDLRQCSPRDRSNRDRSPRDRPPGDHFRDRPPRAHSPRDRDLRRRSPGERSRGRDDRRQNDSQSQNRYSIVDRSPPRSRRNERDRDRRVGNRRDERSRRTLTERPQRSQGPERHPRSERPERPQRPERFERSGNDCHNRGFDHRRAPRDIDQRFNQKQDFSTNPFENYQQNPALYGEESSNDIHNRNFDYRQPPCDVDHRINQNFNHQLPELPHSKVFQQNPVAYSSSPNNSTFVQPNIFTEKPVFQLDNIASMYDPDPCEPPSKKMRVSGIEPPRFNKQFNKFNQSDKPFSKFQPKFQDDTFPSQNQDISLSVKLSRQKKWIMNAAKILSKQIRAYANGGVIPDNPECLPNLRKCIISRIDVILGDRISNTLRDIIDAYRAKFGEDDDPGFFKAVMDKIERDSKESLKSEGDEAGEMLSPDAQPGPSNANNFIPNPNGGKFKLRAAKQNANFNIAAAYKNYAKNGENDEEAGYHLQNPRLNISKPSDPTKRLPSFPQGDKQIYKDQKKLQKLELHEEIYTLEPTMKKALDDEMALLCELYKSACEEPILDDKQQDSMRVKIKNQILPEFKKIVNLHMTKRLLNIPNNLVIRIFAHPKPPKRIVIDEFLRNYDVASLRKSEKKHQTFFLVTCASYESYDDILKLGKYKVSDTCTLQFRAMHLIGPKNSGNPAKLKRGKSNIPPENIIPDDEVEELLEESTMDIENHELNIDDSEANDENEINFDEDGNENQENDENELNIDEHGNDNQENERNELNFHKDGDDSENLNKNILDDYSDIGKQFTNDDIKYDEFTNWNDKCLDDSDVVLVEKTHDIVVIDDNDKTVIDDKDTITFNDVLDEENNDNDNAASNNDDKEEVNANAENDDGGLDRNTNIVDEGMIEGVDVTEDDLEDF